MHSQRMGVPQGSPSGKWLSAKRRKWIPFKPALTKSKRADILKEMMAECQRYIGGEFLDVLKARCR